jgi:dipeptidase D
MKHLTKVLITATLVTLLLGAFVPASASPPAQSQAAATIQPLPAEVCNGQAQALAHALDVVEVTQSEAPLSDPVTGASGSGCQATVTGTGEQFASPDAAVNTLGSMLEEEGWTQDPMLAAGGPTGFGAGYRKGDQMCMADAQWWPDPSANCPQDQPVSACQVTPAQQNYTITLNCGLEVPAAGTAVQEEPAADPLPSWNPGPAKDAILQFVADVTDPANSSYVAPADRIAVSDNDGTLWTEQPIPAQAAFIFARIEQMAPEHPEWRTTQPYEAVLEHDVEALQSMSPEEVEELLFATHAGMTEEEFEAEAKAFLDTALHPRFGVPYTATVYQPMLELLAFLQANGFRTFIVSGGGVEFMRTFSEEVYGIPRENVVGSSLQYEFELTDDGSVLIRQPELTSFDNREMKPANIQLEIGRRPILAAGNSDGDLEMFQYTGGDEGPYLNLLIVHDDAEREYDYLTGADEVMTAAAQSPWMFVSMKDDFKTIFPGAPQPATEPQPAAEPQTTVVSPTAMVPLKDTVATMDPQDVWQAFYDVTQVPRPSHHEEQITAYLAQFGQDLGLETIVDDVGNVLIRRPAAPGLENRHGVILQAHMDMVAQKTDDSTHDFLTDPIAAYVDGEWVVADGTTLGADDGIGVAIAMAVLQSQTLELGPIEALFTVNEEDGMDGAQGLQPGLLQGDTLINLDSNTEGMLLIGSAGGDYADVNTSYAQVAVPAGMTAFTVTVSGLQGGHSGVDIDKGLGHATRLLVRLLSPAAETYGVRLAQIAGGTAANAIPQEAAAVVVVPAAQADAFVAYVQAYEQTVQHELAAVEPTLRVQATATDIPVQVMDEAAQRTLVNALYATPQGVIRMSDFVTGLVETSNNMGIVGGVDGEMAVTCYPRSSVDSELDDINQMIASVWDLAGVEVVFSGRYPGWAANSDSSILSLMEDVYQDLYGLEPQVTAVHAGTECGTIVAKYPGMDAISIGPTIQKEHTTDERLEIASVKKLNDLLLETLARIPEKP